MNKKVIKFVYFSFLLVAIMSVSACGRKDKEEDKVEIKKKVQVQNIVKQNEVTSNLLLSATVVPQEYSIIRSLSPGTVEFLAPVGSEISAGQALFSIRDSGIENNYFNTLQSFQQTQIVSSQGISQAELSLNSAKARLDLARIQYNNMLIQTEQALANTQDSAVANYNSAYNTLKQFYLFLNKDLDLRDKEYVYNDLLTPQIQLKSDLNLKFNNSLDYFNGIANTVTVDDVRENMPRLQQALALSKDVVDDTVILLQSAVSSNMFPTVTIESDKGTMISYQATINTHLSGIIAAINSIVNTGSSNNLAINNAQSQLDLAEIEYKNSEIALQNSKDGANLQTSAMQSQLDQATYNYNNLTLSSPFSGTILSHFVAIGEQVAMGRELIEIGNLSLVEMTVDMDVEFAKALKLADEVKINNKYTGLITEIEPIGDLTSGKVSVTVQSQPGDEDLSAGSIAELEFILHYENVEAIVIPIKSATIESSGNYVYVVVDGKISRKTVTLGQIFGDKVSVLSGLTEGDKLVILNGVFVSNDEAVEIIE